MSPDAYPSWQVQDRFLELHSRWMTLIGEHWQDAQGQRLEYWRIEKADSVMSYPFRRMPWLSLRFCYPLPATGLG
jgi:hypothetical protein